MASDTVVSIYIVCSFTEGAEEFSRKPPDANPVHIHRSNNLSYTKPSPTLLHHVWSLKVGLDHQMELGRAVEHQEVKSGRRTKIK